MLFVLTATIFVLIFTGLAIWQVQRAQMKQELLRDMKQHGTQVMTLVPDTFNPASQYRRIQLQGQFDHQHVFFLDNRWYQQVPGYELLQIFRPIHGLPILVNRGFVSHQGNREVWPEVATISGIVTIHGRLNHPKPGFQLADIDDTPTGWPKLIQSIDFDAISNKVKYPIAPYVVMIAEDSPYAYPSAWQPSILGAARHWGYAAQWGLLALTVSIATVITMRK